MRVRVAIALTMLCAADASAIDFTRIERWTGSGTNRAALVVDWNSGRNPHALAWGFRWNGSASTLDLLQAVTNSDVGLILTWTNTETGLRVSRIEYRRSSQPGDLLPEIGSGDFLLTAYGRDFTGAVFQAGDWTHWVNDVEGTYDPTNGVLFTSGVVNRVLQNNGWDAFSLSTSNSAQRPSRVVAPAPHYPFAREVIGYSFGSGAPPVDWITGDSFTNAAAALGRPTVDTTYQSTSAPVVPVYPAFRAHEIVSIGPGGYLELAFDHRVFDHPDNPHGFDFIVFGNSAQTIGGGAAWTNGDPNATVVGASCFVEKGRVYVSQDAVTWHEFTNGPYADDFAPTLGRIYDVDSARTNLGPWNQWWAGATDPTIPVDPSVMPSNWAGYSAAQIAQRYRGGAGGVGFDISSLPLALDDNTGLKWIRYVRIERSGALNPEIDAIADVSPLPPHARWMLQSFAWMSEPSDSSDISDPDADGTLNLLEYATGRDPLVPNGSSVLSISVLATNLHVRFPLATNAVDVRAEVEQAMALTSVWQTNGIIQEAEIGAPSDGLRAVTAVAPVGGDAGFFRLRVRHED